MTVGECETAYADLAKHVFYEAAALRMIGSPLFLGLAGKPRFDSRKLKAAILEVIEDNLSRVGSSNTEPEEIQLLDGKDTSCKVYFPRLSTSPKRC